MKIKQEKILIRLAEAFGAEEVKYSVFEKSFIVKKADGEVSYTLATTLKYLDENSELAILLDKLNSSYFPRRLKQVLESFYQTHGLEMPPRLIICPKGFQIKHDGQTSHVEYQDDFEVFLKQMAEIYGVDYIDFDTSVDASKQAGEYHK